MPRIAIWSSRGAALLLAGLFLSALLTPPADAAGPVTLRVSTSVTRNGSKPLGSATVAKSVAMFVSTRERVRSAAFYLDNTKLSGRPYRTDLGPELDLGGTARNRQAVAFDTLALRNGAHWLSARVVLQSGRAMVVHARFTVANKTATTATTTPPAVVNPAKLRFPDATTTGVPAGTKLTAVNGDVWLTTPGMVYSGKDVNGCITIKADNITIRASRIRCARQWAIRSETTTKNLLVEDVEITGGDQPYPEGVAIGWSNFTLRRADIHGISDGPRLHTNAIVEDSYIHDLSTCGQACHNDGIQSTGGSNITIRHNNIQNPGKQTSAILLGEALGPLDSALIEDNLLNGGNYTLYLGQGTTDPNVIVRGNHFGRDHVYGLLRTSAGAKVVWHDNVWDDTGAPVERPRG